MFISIAYNFVESGFENIFYSFYNKEKIKRENTMEEKIIKELHQKYNVNENYIRLLFKICKDNNVINIKVEIEEFLSSTSISKAVYYL